MVGVSVNAAITSGNSFGGRNVTTDAEGRFVIIVSAGAMVSLWAFKQGYVQPCAATMTVNDDTVRDVEIISEAAIASNSAQLARVTPPTLTGTVFEQTVAGWQPASGVIVGAEYDFDFVNASARSDAAGRYLLCGLPERVVLFYIARPGIGPTYQPVGTIDFRLGENRQRVVRDIQIGVPW